MNNAKVALPKEVAEVIEELREIGYTDAQIIHGFECGQLREPLHSYFYEGERSSDVLMPALVNGYTIEKSPEEIIRETYEELSDYVPVDRACKDGFRFVLDKLGIKIEGVNAQ